MPSATDTLRREHQSIKGALQFAERVSARMNSGQDVPFENLATLMEFIRLFVEQAHHTKEEHILFPLLEERGIRGPVGVMLLEHGRARVLIEEMSSAVADVGPRASQDAAKRWVRAAWNYSDLMYEHFYKEEEMLFNMADRVLSPEEQASIAQAFERLDHETLGAGRHEHLRAAMAELVAQNK
ncbi:MAG: hemerythrin domain-containing protein [Acidobacteriota bacterium]|nr:hemerythrin domain-containing protein [Acidobacteriota bacterium]